MISWNKLVIILVKRTLPNAAIVHYAKNHNLKELRSQEEK